ncbi:MAG: 4'-phosphopantetheinyl transferase superfamily protein [Acidobacteria bacterium]|nr:4'-phosphopantetheinyl transferase superfamily protein [Acidobacteriota bacterium]
MAAPSSLDVPRVVRVWHATVDQFVGRNHDARTRALAMLRPAEHERYTRFRHDADRQMFLIGRVMARTIVGDALGIAPHDWPWREGRRGRPEVDLADCPVSFNLAHSAGLVVCALSVLGPVGVDVEHRFRTPLERALVTRCCASDEAADVDTHGEAWRDHFLKYWTLKESYLKAVGLGISVHLPDVRFRIAGSATSAFTGSLAGADAGWTFDLQPLPPAHYVAVATSTPDGVRSRVEHLPFPESWWP